MFGAWPSISEHPGSGSLVIVDITVQLFSLKAAILLGGYLLSSFIKRHFIPTEKYSQYYQKSLFSITAVFLNVNTFLLSPSLPPTHPSFFLFLSLSRTANANFKTGCLHGKHALSITSGGVSNLIDRFIF